MSKQTNLKNIAVIIGVLLLAPVIYLNSQFVGFKSAGNFNTPQVLRSTQLQNQTNSSQSLILDKAYENIKTFVQIPTVASLSTSVKNKQNTLDITGKPNSANLVAPSKTLASLSDDLDSLHQKKSDDSAMDQLIDEVKKARDNDKPYMPEIEDLISILNDNNLTDHYLISNISKMLKDIREEKTTDDALNYMLDSYSDNNSFSISTGECYDDPEPQNRTEGVNTWALCCDEECCDMWPCVPSCKDQADGHNYIYDYETLDCAIDF